MGVELFLIFFFKQPSNHNPLHQEAPSQRVIHPSSARGKQLSVSGLSLLLVFFPLFLFFFPCIFLVLFSYFSNSKKKCRLPLSRLSKGAVAGVASRR